MKGDIDPAVLVAFILTFLTMAVLVGFDIYSTLTSDGLEGFIEQKIYHSRIGHYLGAGRMHAMTAQVVIKDLQRENAALSKGADGKSRGNVHVSAKGVVGKGGKVRLKGGAKEGYGAGIATRSIGKAMKGDMLAAAKGLSVNPLVAQKGLKKGGGKGGSFKGTIKPMGKGMFMW
ncbi:unnamed protein product [Amoebophrya sp. A25]|nr:unnamed protein product [Amoebophrya sp. A25]|eukprot:GSA25T00012555001.1